MARLDAEVGVVLSARSIRTVWQPVVALGSGAVVGFEALSRGPAGSAVDGAAALFAAARRAGTTDELERLCLSLAVRRAGGYGTGGCSPGKTFLNVSPRQLQEPGLAAWLGELAREAGIDPGSIVVELTEDHALADLPALLHALDACRGAGFMVALDDLGTGADDLRLVREVRPDVVKLDRSLLVRARRCGEGTWLTSLVRAARQAGAVLVAEGIETEEDLWRVQRLGVEWGQGYLLGPPAPRPPPPGPGTARTATTTGGEGAPGSAPAVPRAA